MEIIKEVTLLNIEELHDLTKALSPFLKEGDIIALDGDLGAGKTEFSRSLIHSFGFKGDVPSPTFTLLQIYEVDKDVPVIYHFDLYRLENPAEAFELGIEDAFDAGLSLIEWPSRLGDYLPEGYLALYFKIGENDIRNVTIVGDKTWQKRLKKL